MSNSNVKDLDNEEVDIPSIAIWFSTGFFLGNSNFLYNKPYELSKFGPNIDWFYNPRDISLEEAVDEFANIFESLIYSKIKGKKLILPLSGGLDSRTIAAALSNYGKIDNLVTISYELEGGVKETEYAKRIANTFDWEFHSFKIPNGYLWPKINELSKINKCLIDFTHSRQMAVIDKISRLGDLLLSGQWGDVLFDTPGVKHNANLDDQVHFSIKKNTKPGGIELAADLWDYWGFEGDFRKKLYQKIKELLLEIKINNPNSRIRAFKSIHWAHRWANEGLKIFDAHNEMLIPYYHDKMCEFVCTIPEKYLLNRKIQIEYIKRRAPELAKISWQKYDMNLYNYKYFNNIYFPFRVLKFFKQRLKKKIYGGPQLIQRNWELQFLGEKNDERVK